MALALAGAMAGTAPPAGAAPPAATGLLLTSAPAGYAAAPPGPTDGTLTPTEFATESDAPAAVAAFGRLAGRPGFGAAVRLWTLATGPERGRADLVVLVVRLPTVTDATAFAAGLAAAGRQPGAVPFGVPGVPGAVGWAEAQVRPVAATEEAVVLRAGDLVAEVEAAGAGADGTGVLPLPTLAMTAERQDRVLAASLPHPRRPAPTGPAPAAAPGPSATGLAGVGLLVAAAVAGLVAAVPRVRRRRRRADPWAPGGLLDAFGAVPVPSRPAVRPPGTVPMLVGRSAPGSTV